RQIAAQIRELAANEVLVREWRDEDASARMPVDRSRDRRRTGGAAAAGEQRENDEEPHGVHKPESAASGVPWIASCVACPSGGGHSGRKTLPSPMIWAAREADPSTSGPARITGSSLHTSRS